MRKYWDLAILAMLGLACINGLAMRVDVANSCLLIAILFAVLRGTK